MCAYPHIIVLNLALPLAEAQRRASQNNFSLSEENLQEYRRLFVFIPSFDGSDLMLMESGF